MKKQTRQERQQQIARRRARYARHGRKPPGFEGLGKIGLSALALLLFSGQSPLKLEAPATARPARIAVRSEAPMRAAQATPPVLTGLAPAAQIERLAAHYGIAQSPEGDLQQRVVRALVKDLAARHGVPEAIAIGLSGHESGQGRMWEGEVVSNANYDAEGQLLSTDWGLMQLNDAAHPSAFPRAAQELVYNVDYGLGYLAALHKVYRGSLNLGFGDWDATLAAYNLGHAPASDEMGIASRYLGRMQAWLRNHGIAHQPRYTVQTGDTLASIAAARLGDGQRWQAIAAVNPGLSPRTLRPGHEIALPVYGTR